MGRPKGEGTIWQEPSGRWRGAVVTGWTEHGTPRRRTVSGPSEAEVKRKLRNLVRDLRDGQVSLDQRMTVKRWCDTWLEDYDGVARPGTRTTDGGNVRRWIVPELGNRRLSELTAADVRGMDRAIVRAGRSPTTAHNVHMLLLRILRAAIAEGYMVPDAALAARVTSVAESDRDALPLDTAVAVLNAALHPEAWPELPPLPPLGRGRKRDPALVAQHGQRRLALETDASRWTGGLLQGMRQAECRGMTWDCVDLAAGTMDVSWQLQRVKPGTTVPSTLRVRPLVGAYALTSPKTAAGERIVPLVPWMTTALEQWRERCPESPHGLVWPRPDGGPMSPSDDRAAWMGLQQAAGIAMPERGHWIVHEQRHTTVSLLEAAGVPSAVIIAIVGHASYNSTKRYAHADLERARAALEQVAEALKLAA